MPTYDYECENGHRFEYFQSMKDAPLSACVECGAKAKRRIGPGAGFLFKGGGFYITENRSKEYKDKAKSEPSGSSTDGGGTSANTSPKPASSDKSGSAGAAKPSSDKGTSGGGGTSGGTSGGSSGGGTNKGS